MRFDISITIAHARKRLVDNKVHRVAVQSMMANVYMVKPHDYVVIHLKKHIMT